MPPYNPGETAGFPDDKARSLIDRGIAMCVSGTVAHEGQPITEAPAEQVVEIVAEAYVETPSDKMITTEPGRRGRQARR